jgi:hypothetical protein
MGWLLPVENKKVEKRNGFGSSLSKMSREHFYFQEASQILIYPSFRPYYSKNKSLRKNQKKPAAPRKEDFFKTDLE